MRNTKGQKNIKSLRSIKILTSQEKKLLCDKIGGNEIRKYFLKEPDKFTKHIQGGWRINKLSNQDALKIAKEYIKSPYITFFLYMILKHWNEQFEQNYIEMIDNGVAEDVAVLASIIKSPFKAISDIFFKLSDRDYKEDTKKKCLFILEAENSSKNILPEKEERINTSLMTDEKIQKQLKEKHELWQLEKRKLKHKIQEQEDIIQKLDKEKKQLKAKENKLSYALERQQSELKVYQEMDKYREELKYEPSQNFPYTSLCKEISQSHKNKHVIKLQRLADIDKNGRIVNLYAENTPERDILYYNSAGGFSEGMIGIWNWNQEPNRWAGKSDFVTSNFNKTYSPVEIIILPECNSDKQLIRFLYEGIAHELAETINRVLFVYPKGFHQYSGVLCTRKQLNEMHGRCILQNKFFKLPVYDVGDTEIFSTEEHMFYRRLYLGIPERLLSAGNVMETIKELLLERVSWSKMKWKGFTKAEYKEVHAFIEGLQTDDFIQGVMERCDCSDVAEASELIDKFKRNAEGYINQTNLESEIVEDVVRRNEDLLEIGYKSVEEEWRTSHAGEMNKLKNELNKVRDTIADEKQNLSSMQKKYDNLKRESNKITTDIKRQQLLADTVEQQVKQRITSIQENAASFLTDMMFQIPLYQNSYKNISESSNKRMPEKIQNNYFVKGTLIPTLKGEFISDDEACIELLKENLIEAGVIRDISKALATYLYVAHLLHIPLILTGPGSTDIANAMAITFTGRTADQLTFTGEVYEHSINCCLQDDGEFTTIINPFNTNWAYKLPELLRNPSKYFVLATPYPEELQIEPASLYNLALPVLTDVLVDKKATGQYISVKKSASYKEQRITYDNGNHRPFPLLRSLEISSLARTYLQELYHYFSMNWNDSTDEFFFMYGVLPLAYSMGKINIVKVHIQEKGPHFSKTNYDLVKPYLGD